MDQLASQQSPERPALAVLSPAGSGKTTAIEDAINRCHNAGVIVAPTGRLAATFRQTYPLLDVDTIHGGFLLFESKRDTAELMQPFDFVVVEELGKLGQLPR